MKEVGCFFIFLKKFLLKKRLNLKILILLFLQIIILESAKIKMGIDENYPPHEYVLNNVPSGFNVDIARIISIKKGMEIEFKPMVWSNAFNSLKEGKIDALFMAYSKEREKYFDFTDENILELHLAIFVNNEVIGIDSLDKLNYHTVAVEKNDISYDILIKNAPNAIILPIQNQADGLMMLHNREVFAFFGNKCTGTYIIQTRNYDNIKMIGEEIKIGERKIAVKKGNINLKKFFDDGLRKIKKSGEYDKIFYKWFGIEFLRLRKIIRKLLTILIIIVLAFLILIIWNRILNRLLKIKHKKIIELEKSYKEVFNTIPHPILILDKENKIFLANPTLLKLANEEFENINSKNLFDIKFFKQYKKELEDILNNIEHNKVYRAAKIKIQINGKDNFFQIGGYKSLIHIGEVKIITFNNVTPFEILSKRITQVEKMESIGRFVATIAHDFNNILTSLISLNELILSKNNLSNDLREDLENMLRISNKAVALINKLLTFSRQRNFSMQTVNLNVLIKSFKDIFNRLLPENIKVEFYLDENLYDTKLDPLAFEQIILNLASNSKDAMPNGGKIIIETKNVTLDRDYISEHPEVKSGVYCMLSFSDNGIGIEKNIIDKIFEPFFTTKKDGTGLGLTTIYNIMNKINGYIFVYSEPKKGTTFKLYFPAIKKRLPEKKEKEIIKLENKSFENKIALVVEDDNDIRNLIVRFLTELKVKTYSAKSGIAALNILKALKEKVDFAIVDLVLPDISGKDFVDSLKKDFPEVKVLYISGYTENVITKNGMIPPEINFIQKPFALKNLYKKLSEML